VSDFHGFSCDACGKVWTLDKRTKVRMVFERTEFCDLGTYTRDLCPDCTAEPFGWNPTRRNRNAPQPRHSPVPEADTDTFPPDPNQPGVG
jgi:hypothetical protein